MRSVKQHVVAVKTKRRDIFDKNSLFAHMDSWHDDTCPIKHGVILFSPTGFNLLLINLEYQESIKVVGQEPSICSTMASRKFVIDCVSYGIKRM